MNLDEILECVFDQLNVTTIIAVAGFCISLWTSISSWMAKRKNLRFAIYFARAAQDTVYFRLGVENLSQLPIAISRVQIKIGDAWFDCTPLPTIVQEHVRRSGKEIISRETVYSSALPIDLGPLGAFKGVLLFEGLPTLPEKRETVVNLRVSTNRGKAFETLVPLLSGWDYHSGNN